MRAASHYTLDKHLRKAYLSAVQEEQPLQNKWNAAARRISTESIYGPYFDLSFCQSVSFAQCSEARMKGTPSN